MGGYFKGGLKKLTFVWWNNNQGGSGKTSGRWMGREKGQEGTLWGWGGAGEGPGGTSRVLRVPES